jgi:hypothetical protein
MAESGIVPQPVPAYTPEANGRAERLNRILVEKSACTFDPIQVACVIVAVRYESTFVCS